MEYCTYKIKYCANLGAEVFSSETKDKGFQCNGDVKNSGFQHHHGSSVFSERLQGVIARSSKKIAQKIFNRFRYKIAKRRCNNTSLINATYAYDGEANATDDHGIR